MRRGLNSFYLSFQEGLLDRFDWLQWIISACDRAQSLEDGVWKALVPLLLAFIPDVAQSEFLARRLANLAARRLSTLFNDLESPGSSPPGAPGIQPPATLLEHLHCPAHRSTVLALVSALQVITLECPTALVYNGNNLLVSSPSLSNNGNSITETPKGSLIIGSALDLLPIPPSALPMPPRANNPIIRAQLRASEELIRLRSRAAEAKWACEEWQLSSAGINSLLEKHFPLFKFFIVKILLIIE
jgi:mediator of RNA polymerase II transcription subunit 12